jgi:hypothetical protein
MDVIIGLTAFSALQSNGESFKPIHYLISFNHASSGL